MYFATPFFIPVIDPACIGAENLWDASEFNVIQKKGK